MDFFRDLHRFIRLIPQSRQNMKVVEDQIDRMRVSVTSRIDVACTLHDGKSGIKGNTIEVQHWLESSDFLHLILTERSAAAKLPHYDLVNLLATQYKIKKTNHRLLLYTALTNSDLRVISSIFQEQDVQVKGLILGKSKRSANHSPGIRTDSNLRKLKRSLSRSKSSDDGYPVSFLGRVNFQRTE
jgi:hypothetical protein